MSETTHTVLEALRRVVRRADPFSADLGPTRWIMSDATMQAVRAAIPQLEALLRDDHANKAALSRIARAVCVTEVEEDGMRLVKPDDVAAAVERLIMREGKDDIERGELLAALEGVTKTLTEVFDDKPYAGHNDDNEELRVARAVLAKARGTS